MEETKETRKPMAHKLAMMSRDSIRDVWGHRMPTVNGMWPARVDERVIEEPDRLGSGGLSALLERVCDIRDSHTSSAAHANRSNRPAALGVT